MTQKDKFNEISIDKLVLCYRTLKGSLINHLNENKNEYFTWYDLELYRVENCKYYNDVYRIVCRDFNENNNWEYFTFGEIRFNQKSDTNGQNNGLVWFSIENATLYRKYNHDSTFLVCLDYIEGRLNIELNNISHIDLAMDSKENFAKKLKSLIRNPSLKPIIFGKEIKDRDDEIKHITFCHQSTANKYLNPTLYFRDKNAQINKSKGITACCYNKAKEIADKGGEKKYILQKYGMPKKLFRFEIRLHNSQIKEFLKIHDIELSNNLLIDKDLLEFMFNSFLNRIIRFKDENGKTISSLEAIKLKAS